MRDNNFMRFNDKIRIPLSLISKTRKRKYFALTIVQAFLPIFDLAGILMLGLLLQAVVNPNYLNQLKTKSPHLNEIARWAFLHQQKFVLLLTFSACILFILKGLFATSIVLKTYKLLSSASVDFSDEVASNFFKGNLTRIQYLPSVRVSSALNDSINHQIVSILGAFSALVGENALILLICTFLLTYSFTVTLLCFMYFLGVYLLLQRLLRNSTSNLAIVRNTSDTNIRNMVQESINSYRELSVVNAISGMLNGYHRERVSAAESQSKIFWLTSLPKYVFETVLVVGVLLLMVLNFLTGVDATSQLTLATFLIAGVRILPSILRIQALANTIEYSHSSSAYLNEVIDLSHKFPTLIPNSEIMISKEEASPDSFIPKITISNLIFSYHEESNFKLKITGLQIFPGERVALVGASGSGKSTFADLILGVVRQNSGEILLSHLSPREAIKYFPGKVGYVPQSPNLFSTDVFGNIALYQPRTKENIARAWDCLEFAQLATHIKDLPKGMDTLIGDGGHKLSGGQKQRLSIARALFPNPELLVLDEATSALDSETENNISLVIQELNINITVIAIAHRLSTIKTFNRILYFEDGQIVGDGLFDELRMRIPKFDIQASLSGY